MLRSLKPAEMFQVQKKEHPLPRALERQLSLMLHHLPILRAYFLQIMTSPHITTVQS